MLGVGVRGRLSSLILFVLFTFLIPFHLYLGGVFALAGCDL